jgi:hypothetical protein
MSEQTPPATGVPHRTYRDPRGHPVAYDGAAPVTWRVGAYVLAERGGRGLMTHQWPALRRAGLV